MPDLRGATKFDQLKDEAELDFVLENLHRNSDDILAAMRVGVPLENIMYYMTKSILNPSVGDPVKVTA